jgi:hypothetical protein
MKKSKSEICLNALLNVSYPIFLHKDYIGKSILCFDYNESCTPSCDITLHDFINLCNKISDENITKIENGENRI